jgi:hypothetical protein
MWPSRVFKIQRPGRLFGVGCLLACSLYLHKINPYVILLPNWSYIKKIALELIRYLTLT